MESPTPHPVFEPRFPGDLPGARRDVQSITADWRRIQDGIQGAQLREVRGVPTSDGLLTEVFRSDLGAGRRMD